MNILVKKKLNNGSAEASHSKQTLAKHHIFKTITIMLKYKLQ